jgi:hypothetical protein
MPIIVLFLSVVLVEPVDIIYLDREFNRIELYDGTLYLAPFIGTSIFKFTELKNLSAISFTDDVNYRIHNFHITPFAIYLNNGKSIEKFYRTQGVKEMIYSSQDITTFIVTPSEEVICTDRMKRELIFLDFTNTIKFKETDIQIKDLQIFDNDIYALTHNSIVLFDEYGNAIDKKQIPEKCDRILVDSVALFLFSSNKKYCYTINGDVQKIEYSHSIRDMCIHDGHLVILDGNGSRLYFYNKSHID